VAVHLERHDRVAVVSLDDPERRNAMTLPLVADLVAVLDGLEADDGVGAVVVTGCGPAFCSGADLSDLGGFAAAEHGEKRAITAVYEGFLRVLRCPLPTVAAVNGPAVGAGLNLALACDVRLAGASARFDARFLRIGLHPGGGHTWMLERLTGPQTSAAMVLFGTALDADAAVERGLAWSKHPDAELLDAAVALAGRAAGAPRELAVRAKATLRQAPFTADFDQHLALEVEHQTWSLGQPWFAQTLAARRPAP